MDSKDQTNSNSRAIIHLKATCYITSILIISIILWIVGCEILWYGTVWIEDVYERKDRFNVYKIIFLILFLGFGILTVVVSTSFVLLGIPFTVLHVNHLFNRENLFIPRPTRRDNDELRPQQSKQAFIWAISIFLLVIIGLAIGGTGCEVVQWSGNQFRSLFQNNTELDKMNFYLKQCSFLAIMFIGLLLSFAGLLLAPFMLAFAGVVSFDKKRNSYRFRSRRGRPCQ
ncbi:unnamed protein product [Adineta ricciae]|uniref:Uncharacterized protein n=1 Tax=Adineta ricciae TaxID=249248 RepID=A0A813V4H2_ADIRI|nr:unnamed protein product [Adineta ricciae]CAF0977770.1 unnamed protein product [Adineta ricciae]